MSRCYICDYSPTMESMYHDSIASKPGKKKLLRTAEGFHICSECEEESRYHDTEYPTQEELEHEELEELDEAA
jgi:hypothetical protein